jgi:hypothetical protein
MQGTHVKDKKAFGGIQWVKIPLRDRKVGQPLRFVYKGKFYMEGYHVTKSNADFALKGKVPKTPKALRKRGPQVDALWQESCACRDHMDGFRMEVTVGNRDYLGNLIEAGPDGRVMIESIFERGAMGCKILLQQVDVVAYTADELLYSSFSSMRFMAAPFDEGGYELHMKPVGYVAPADMVSKRGRPLDLTKHRQTALSVLLNNLGNSNFRYKQHCDRRRFETLRQAFVLYNATKLESPIPLD